MLQQIGHFLRITVAIGTDTGGEGQTIVDKFATQLSKSAVFAEIEGTVVIDRLGTGSGKNAVEGAVVVAHVFVPKAKVDAVIAGTDGIFQTQFVFDLLGLVVQNQVFAATAVVLIVLDGLVVEHVATQYHGIVAIGAVVFVHQAVGVTPLWGFGQAV